MYDFPNAKHQKCSEELTKRCPIVTDCFFASECDYASAKKQNNKITGKILKFKKGDIISNGYEIESSLFIIVSGIGIAKCYLESGEEIAICLMGKGQTFGEAFPITGKQPISLYALTELSVCKVPSSCLSNGNAEMAKKVLYAGMNNYYAFARQVWIMNAQRSYERIKRTLMVLEDLHESDGGQTPIDISHRDIASIINTDRPTVTRALRRLKEEGLVDLSYQNISINTPATFCKIEDMFRTDASRKLERDP